jgi:dephospho-CoA kinase
MQNKLRPIRIGITGGIGSGKSLACRYFEELGYKVVYADDIAKRLYKMNPALKKKLVAEFGRDIINEKGDIGGESARKIIFSSKKNILRVNSIVHPFVIKEIDRQISKIKKKIVLVETAIMFESGYYTRNDYNVLIYANKGVRAKRVKERDKVSMKTVEKLMNLQMKETDKIIMADFVIKNNSTKAELKKDVKMFSKILEIL